MITLLRKQHYDFLKDDPVRPHLPSEWRTQYPREVYALYEDKYAQYDEPLTEDPLAIICVAYTNSVPTTEADLDNLGTDIAVFYTVWSYSKGAGRDLVNGVAQIIKDTHQCSRYVTLSPLTAMAERFHLTNGAEFIARYDTCQNFEYHI